jgi:AraC-like DNA-binding protein
MYLCDVEMNWDTMDNTKKTTLLDYDKISKEGVAVVELKGAQSYHGPISSPHYIISLCDSGIIDMEYDSMPERFTPHDIAVLYPQHTCITRQATPDYHITMIVVSADLYAKMSRLNFSNKRFDYEQLPHFHLSDSQYDDMLAYIDTLRRITRLDFKSREDTLVSCIYTLSQIIDHYHDTAVGPAAANIKWLSHRFYNAIIENCHQHRDVRFYANIFCLTPKHFSSVVKQQTEHTAGYWIRHYLIMRLKQTLAYEPEASIQSIAERFCFPDQSTFSRFFKRETGVSPTEYRISVS